MIKPSNEQLLADHDQRIQQLEHRLNNLFCPDNDTRLKRASACIDSLLARRKYLSEIIGSRPNKNNEILKVYQPWLDEYAEAIQLLEVFRDSIKTERD